MRRAGINGWRRTQQTKWPRERTGPFAFTAGIKATFWCAPAFERRLRSESEARALASQVKIAEGPGKIEPNGPSEDHSHHWNVSYEVWMPGASNLETEAHNGSIGIDGVHGEIRFNTVNGSVHLSKVGGDVDGSTTNGSVNIDLAGNSWSGKGLRAETTNGTVRMNIPANYSAKVETSTVNGRVHVDFPITVSGEIGKSLSFRWVQADPRLRLEPRTAGSTWAEIDARLTSAGD